MCLSPKWVLVGWFWVKLGLYWTHISVCKGKWGFFTKRYTLMKSYFCIKVWWNSPKRMELDCPICVSKYIHTKSKFQVSRPNYDQKSFWYLNEDNFRLGHFVRYPHLPLQTQMYVQYGTTFIKKCHTRPQFGGKHKLGFTPKSWLTTWVWMHV